MRTTSNSPKKEASFTTQANRPKVAAAHLEKGARNAAHDQIDGERPPARAQHFHCRGLPVDANAHKREGGGEWGRGSQRAKSDEVAGAIQPLKMTV